MTAIFVTGTGTDVGKTFVTAGLIRALRRRKRPVAALKPVVTGVDPARVEGSDPCALLTALDLPITDENIERLSPWRYRAALSPDMAAYAEGRRLDVDGMIGFCRSAIAGSPGTLLIEGVGGIMVPLDEHRTVLDWMVALRLPLVLVAGSYLGTLSHTLSALDVVTRRGLAVKALVVSETLGATVPLEDTLATLARFANAVPLRALPRLAAGTDHPLFDDLARFIEGRGAAPRD